MNDATAAWDFGYGAAVKGATRNFCPANITANIRREWLAGFEAAIADGKYGTHPDYR